MASIPASRPKVRAEPGRSRRPETSSLPDDLLLSIATVRQFAELHPNDSGAREALTFCETASVNRFFLNALVAYTRMKDDVRVALLKWIALVVGPAKTTWPSSSYIIKHDFEQQLHSHVTELEFKGAMLASGHIPTAPSLCNSSWHYRIKPRVSWKLRPPRGSYHSGPGGFGLYDDTFEELRQKPAAESRDCGPASRILTDHD